MEENRFLLRPSYQKILIKHLIDKNFKLTDFLKKTTDIRTTSNKSDLENSYLLLRKHILIHKESMLSFEFINKLDSSPIITTDQVGNIITYKNELMDIDVFNYSYSYVYSHPEMIKDNIYEKGSIFTDILFSDFNYWLDVIHEFYESSELDDLWNDNNNEYPTEQEIKVLNEYIDSQRDIINTVEIDENFKQDLLNKIDELKPIINSKTKKNVIKQSFEFVVKEGVKEIVKEGIKKYVITQEAQAILLGLFQTSKEFILNYWPTILRLE